MHIIILTPIYGPVPQGCGTILRVNEQPVAMKTYNSMSMYNVHTYK